MKRLIYKLFFLSVLFIGLTACDDQDETEIGCLVHGLER